MRKKLVLAVFMLSQSYAFAFQCGDVSCPGGGVCVKCPGVNCDYCLQGFIAETNEKDELILQEKIPGSAKKLKGAVGGFIPQP